MSLYGVTTDDPDALRAAYAEIELVGARQALRNRLVRMREREEAARTERQRQRQEQRADTQAQDIIHQACRLITAADNRRAIVRDVLDANPGVTLADLVGPSRTTKIVAARQLAMFRISRELGLSLPKIGRMFNRDHTTVLASVRKIAGQGE